MAKIGHSYIIFPSVADPADVPTPEAGQLSLYVLASDGLLYAKDEAGDSALLTADATQTTIPVVASSGDIPTPDAGFISAFILSTDGELYYKDDAGDVTQLTGVFLGDFVADGSVPMTGDLTLGAHAFIIDDISTPSTPASGLFKLYLKSDGLLYIKN